MKRFINLFALLCFVLAFAACTDLPNDNIGKPEPTPDPEAANFDWKVINSLSLNVNVPALEGDINNYSRIVQVYSTDTFEPSTLIATGVASPGKPFKTSIAVPTAVGKLYFLVKNAASRTKFYACEVTDKQVSLDVNIADLPEYSIVTRSGADQYVPAVPPVVTIPDDFDNIIETEFPEKLTDNESYYIPKGKTVTIDNITTLSNNQWIRPSKNTIYVAGKLIISSEAGTSIAGKNIYILDGGSLEAENISFINGQYITYNDPVIYVGQGGSIKANKFKLPARENMIINGGIVDCDEFVMSEHDGHLHVLGLLTARYFTTQWGKVNYLYVYPYSLIEGRDRAGFGSSEVALYRNAIIYSGAKLDVPESHFFVPESDHYSDGSSAAFLRFENTGFLDECKLSVDGPIEVYAPSMLYNKYYTKLRTCLINGAYLSTELTERELYIGKGEHNYNKGYGMFEIIDNDNDGIPNNLDKDDENPDTAASSSYPAIGEFATLMYEDLWPRTGDYDMNDIVTDINVSWITNAENYVNKIVIYWKPRAAGSTKNIGMAVQLDKIAAGEIKSVTTSKSVAGNTPFAINKGLEQGVSTAIIPLFNSIEEVLDRRNANITVNTNPNDVYTQSYTQTTTIEFSNPVNMSDVNIDQLNFFIVVDSRDHEIHLANYKQTEKGKVLDAANNGLDPENNYKTEEGMMWGLMVPKSIAYPKEGVNIEDVYKNYKRWYQSNGNEAKDWYMDKSGYINTTNIYNEPEEILVEE